MLPLLTKVILQLKNASFYSKEGLIAAFRDEFAFRLEILAGIIAMPLAFYIGNSALERVALVSSFLLVPIVELLNSAIELTLNRISSEWSAVTKKAKDIGSAAVFITIMNALLVWAIIIIQY